MISKRARFINTCNSARNHMTKLAVAGGTLASSTVRGEGESDSSRLDRYNAAQATIRQAQEDADNYARRQHMQDRLMVAGAGALGGAGVAYLLARLLKRKKAWAYGLGGAALGAAGGYMGGESLAQMIRSWLASKKEERLNNKAQTAYEAIAAAPNADKVLPEYNGTPGRLRNFTDEQRQELVDTANEMPYEMRMARALTEASGMNGSLLDSDYSNGMGHEEEDLLNQANAAAQDIKDAYIEGDQQLADSMTVADDVSRRPTPTRFKDQSRLKSMYEGKR